MGSKWQRVVLGLGVLLASCHPSDPKQQAVFVPRPVPIDDARERVDPVNHRVWSLTTTGLAFKDTAGGATHPVTIADWQWAHAEYAGCLPDIALGPRGEAVVTSNVTSTLWRLDPQTSAATERRLWLNADQDKEIGFTGLVYSAEHDA